MPNGNDKNYLVKELTRKLSLAKIGVPTKNKELLDEAIDIVSVLSNLLEISDADSRIQGKRPVDREY